MAECLVVTIRLDFCFDTGYGCADGDALKINQFHSPCFSKVLALPKCAPDLLDPRPHRRRANGEVISENLVNAFYLMLVLFQ